MVPNIFHFIFGLKEDFGDKPFNLCHYLAIESAIHLNNPDKVYFHYQYEPSGEWFKLIKNKIHLKKVTPPITIFGNPLYHIAHQSDVLRLEILKKYGGIYLDIDTICVRPFTPLLDNSFVIGEQISPNGITIQGFCNAVLLAEPNNEFVNAWYKTYHNFRSVPLGENVNIGGGKNYAYWDEHSVYIPKYLAENKLELSSHIEDYKNFHFPIWDEKGLKMLFEEDHVFPEAYCHHLWESVSWNYLNNLSVDYINKVDTTYNKIARRFL